ncbi:Hypothetical predicted protein [Olea europaea subsp. europaea]|uniref:Uncharacterized protein n=1 Tax=Olea europaea subsp. europaea TaxID=158383 RepID=A0A8S0TLU5_OLEEU|nr:Hypothetical predicted protein [Olea europaea subsp. europaea]
MHCGLGINGPLAKAEASPGFSIFFHFFLKNFAFLRGDPSRSGTLFNLPALRALAREPPPEFFRPSRARALRVAGRRALKINQSPRLLRGGFGPTRPGRGWAHVRPQAIISTPRGAGGATSSSRRPPASASSKVIADAQLRPDLRSFAPRPKLSAEAETSAKSDETSWAPAGGRLISSLRGAKLDSRHVGARAREFSQNYSSENSSAEPPARGPPGPMSRRLSSVVVRLGPPGGSRRPLARFELWARDRGRGSASPPGRPSLRPGWAGPFISGAEFESRPRRPAFRLLRFAFLKPDYARPRFVFRSQDGETASRGKI